jgi:DNA-binding LacI/PurR family transcriptional regulator
MRHLELLITEGVYPPGEMLPPLRVLAKEFASSITPVVNAMRRLERQGVIEPMHGLGFRVKTASGRVDGGKTQAAPTRLIDVIVSAITVTAAGENHSSEGIEIGLFRNLSARGGTRLHYSILPRKHDPRQLSDVLKECLARRPDAFIPCSVEGFGPEEVARLRQIKDNGSCVVLYRARTPVEGIDAVTSDFVLGQRLLTERFLADGHRRILRLSAGDYYYEARKEEGFRAALAAAGAGASKGSVTVADLAMVVEGDPDGRFRVDTLIGGLALAFERGDFTAIFACNDHHAAAVRRALRVLGRPKVVVAGYDGFWSEKRDFLVRSYELKGSETKAPWSVDRRMPEVGRALGDLAFQRMQGELPPEPQLLSVAQLLIPPEA